MLVWLCAILFKDPVITENFIPIFQVYRKCCFDIKTMIYGSFIQNHLECNTLRTGAPSYHYFSWKISFLMSITSFIRIGTIYCPHSNILSIIDAISIKKLLLYFKMSSFQKFVRIHFAIYFRLIF